MTKEAREGHEHVDILLQEESMISEVPEQVLAQAPPRFPPRGERQLLQDLDFNNVNISEEELKARLVSYDAVMDAHSHAVTSLSGNQLVSDLTEALLDTKALQ